MSEISRNTTQAVYCAYVIVDLNYVKYVSGAPGQHALRTLLIAGNLVAPTLNGLNASSNWIGLLMTS